MSRSRAERKSEKLQRKTSELATAAPQVIAKRLERLAAAGPLLSRRDQMELQAMVCEKQVAFAQSWMAMSMQMMISQQDLAMRTLKNAWWPRGFVNDNLHRAAYDTQSAALDVLNKGLAPIHQKAVDNAERLAKKR